MGYAGDVANCREVKALISRLVLCLINGNFVGVRVSFLMLDHVQNQRIFLIAEKYIHMGKCFGYLYLISSGVVATTPILSEIPQCPGVGIFSCFRP